MDSEIVDHHMPEQNVKYGVFAYDEDNNGVGGALLKPKGKLQQSMVAPCI